MKEYLVNLGCGCCTDIVRFINEDSINKAFSEAGMGIVTIVDDEGYIVEGVDTFYGFSENLEREFSLFDIVTPLLKESK